MVDDHDPKSITLDISHILSFLSNNYALKEDENLNDFRCLEKSLYKNKMEWLGTLIENLMITQDFIITTKVPLDKHIEILKKHDDFSEDTVENIAYISQITFDEYYDERIKQRPKDTRGIPGPLLQCIDNYLTGFSKDEQFERIQNLLSEDYDPFFIHCELKADAAALTIILFCFENRLSLQTMVIANWSLAKLFATVSALSVMLMHGTQKRDRVVLGNRAMSELERTKTNLVADIYYKIPVNKRVGRPWTDITNIIIKRIKEGNYSDDDNKRLKLQSHKTIMKYLKLANIYKPAKGKK